jgi:hypothetical protein
MVPRSSVVALAALALAACGAKVDRLDLRTPGAHPGVLPSATLPPPPTATPTPTPTPVPKLARITHAERRVIEGWSEALRQGRVADAARYFSVPSMFEDGVRAFATSRAAVRHFNAGIACGMKLLGMRRGKRHAVLATFRLTRRPGGDCRTGGSLAAVEFLVRRQKINAWTREDDAVDPAIARRAGAATPTATP